MLLWGTNTRGLKIRFFFLLLSVITGMLACLSLYDIVGSQELEYGELISINLAQCVAHALRHNSTLRTQEIIVRQKELQVKDAKTDLFPDLTVQGFWNPNSFEDDDSNFGMTLKLSGGGLEGWRQVSRIKISNLELDLSSLIKQNKQIEMEYLTIKTYLKALLTVEEVAEWQEILKLSESNLKRLRIQYNNRTASLLDLQKGEEVHLNSKLRLLEATARQKNTLNDLKKLMGQAINQRIQLDPGIEEQQFRRATGLSVKEMLVRNPSLKTLEKKIGMIKEKINFSRLGKWPTPFAQGGYQTKPDPRQSTFEISEERDQWYVTLGLQWKLFDWKKTKRKTQQLILDLEKEKILSSQLKTDLEAKWLDLKAKEEHHLKTRGLLEQRLSMLEKQLKLSQNLFDMGKVDLTELTEVDERLKLTHLALKENHYMFLLNSLEMVYLTGESLFPPNILNQYRKHITDDPISPS